MVRMMSSKEVVFRLAAIRPGSGPEELGNGGSNLFLFSLSRISKRGGRQGPSRAAAADKPDR
ncbi:hypothetical protein [Paenibacillus konkukensis]|uniref:hypothetical protein n=1 Tax=Paenibacillus konkukensis TaxID=2020716 RepID=UPI00201D3547|nr:hypothetical protein [Paenibacillus konkukensis]